MTPTASTNAGVLPAQVVALRAKTAKIDSLGLITVAMSLHSLGEVCPAPALPGAAQIVADQPARNFPTLGRTRARLPRFTRRNWRAGLYRLALHLLIARRPTRRSVSPWRIPR